MSTIESIDEDDTNYHLFRDCVFEAIVNKSSTSAKTKKKPSTRRRHSQSSGHIDESPTKSQNEPDPAELAEFSDYLASEIYPSLPSTLQTVNHTTLKTQPTPTAASLSSHPTDAETYSLPLIASTLESLTSLLPPTVHDTLQAYALTSPPTTDTTSFLSPILNAYITHATRIPPVPSSTRTTACELCDRDWIPLTYHHLIPKAVHAKALKRGWHLEERLNSVAWLCRACHSFVHRVAGNEELAKEWFTVERLSEREDVRKWVRWVGGVRWKKR